MKEKILDPSVNADACCSISNKPQKYPEEHEHGHSYAPAAVSFIMLVIGMVVDHFDVSFFHDPWRLIWYSIAYIPVGLPVLKQGWNNILKGDFFTEFFLMGIATIGAFALGHYHEGVAVMLFYAVGELVQHAAVDKSRNNIKALLDVRPNTALVFRENGFVSVHPEEVKVGERIQIRSGEKIPLDGVLLSDNGTLNTAAITGESKPATTQKGEEVYAGSINVGGVIEIESTKLFEDSSIARILYMVQEASSRKAPTELFIRKFARVYTPIVVFAAIALTFLPYLLVAEYHFQDWLYRALIFLVISCPCALVISIPLGYFGGLGAASQNGILFKGASHLDAITKVNVVAMDKTGTLTKGVFNIKEIVSPLLPEKEFMTYLKAIEAQSTHPIAQAIMQYKTTQMLKASDVHETAGHGLSGKVNGKTILAGNEKLLQLHSVSVPSEARDIVESIVLVAIEGEFAGYVVIADKPKEDALEAISQIRAAGVEKIVMLSGDKDSITQKVGIDLKLDLSKGGLLPGDKLKEVEALQSAPKAVVAFVGDGINDAPVIAVADVGIAMGGLGSDVAIETADVVIQTDQPSKIARAIKIGRSTRTIVWQNIGLAFGVKFVVLILGAGGIASMWEAVFADVGVAFLAILNAVRLQKMKWN